MALRPSVALYHSNGARPARSPIQPSAHVTYAALPASAGAGAFASWRTSSSDLQLPGTSWSIPSYRRPCNCLDDCCKEAIRPPMALSSVLL